MLVGAEPKIKMKCPSSKEQETWKNKKEKNKKH